MPHKEADSRRERQSSAWLPEPPAGTPMKGDRSRGRQEPATSGHSLLLLARLSCASAQNRKASLDHLVRPPQQRRRDRQAERLGGLEVDDQLELGGLLDGEFGWVRPFE